MVHVGVADRRGRARARQSLRRGPVASAPDARSRACWTRLSSTSRAASRRRALFETGRVFIERNGQNSNASPSASSSPRPERAHLAEARAGRFLLGEAPRRNARGRRRASISRVSRSLPITDPFYGWQEGQSAVAGEMEHGWTARFGLLNLAMVKAHGIEGKVYAGIFAILPEKLTATRCAVSVSATSACFPPRCAISRWSSTTALPAGEVQKSSREDRARRRRAMPSRSRAVEVFDVYQGKGLPEGEEEPGLLPRLPRRRSHADRRRGERASSKKFRTRSSRRRLIRSANKRSCRPYSSDILHPSHVSPRSQHRPRGESRAPRADAPRKRRKFSAQLGDVLASHRAAEEGRRHRRRADGARVSRLQRLGGGYRRDRACRSRPRCKNAPAQRDNMIAVPKVVE